MFFSGFHTWPAVFFSTFHLVIFRCQTNRGCFSTGSLRVFCFPKHLDRYLKMMPKNRSWRYIFQRAHHLDAIPLAQFPGFFFTNGSCVKIETSRKAGQLEISERVSCRSFTGRTAFQKGWDLPLVFVGELCLEYERKSPKGWFLLMEF